MPGTHDTTFVMLLGWELDNLVEETEHLAMVVLLQRRSLLEERRVLHTPLSGIQKSMAEIQDNSCGRRLLPLVEVTAVIHGEFYLSLNYARFPRLSLLGHIRAT